MPKAPDYKWPNETKPPAALVKETFLFSDKWIGMKGNVIQRPSPMNMKLRW